MLLRWLLAVVVVLAAECRAANFLFMATISSPSHYIWTNRLTEGLLERGHHVTELAIRKPAVKHPNRTSFVIEERTWSEQANLDLEAETDMNTLQELQILNKFTEDTTRLSINSTAFKDLMHHLREKRPKYDVLLIDYVFQEAMLGVSTLIGRPPVVAMTAYNLPEEILALTGTPYFPSLLPYGGAGAHGNLPLSFTERAENLATLLLWKAYHFWYYRPLVNSIIAETFGSTTPLDELEQDVAIALVNTSPALHGPMPLSPAVVEVGGLQACAPRPLPADILAWINKDAAPHGFILFSFGTNVRAATMSQKRKDAIMKALGRVKQRVLWKYDEDDILDQLPPNVRAYKWLPQNDLLGHPNIRCFLSHNGGLSTQESSYHGVPMVGVPFFVDQASYSHKIERLGLGRRLSYRQLTEETLFEVLDDVLNNPRYRENMLRVRATLRDQKETPLERAVWWVEYVARNGGAPHLRSSALELRWYQVWMLDVLAAALAALGAVLAALGWLAARLLTRLTGSSPKQSRKQKAH